MRGIVESERQVRPLVEDPQCAFRLAPSEARVTAGESDPSKGDSDERGGRRGRRWEGEANHRLRQTTHDLVRALGLAVEERPRASKEVAPVWQAVLRGEGGDQHGYDFFS